MLPSPVVVDLPIPQPPLPQSPLTIRVKSSQLKSKLRHLATSPVFQTPQTDGIFSAFISDRDFVTFPAIKSCMEQVLYFNRVNGECKTDVWKDKYTDVYLKSTEIKNYGIIGLFIVPGFTSKFVLVITKRSLVAQIDRFNCIYKIEAIEAIPISKLTQLFTAERNHERRCLEAIHSTIRHSNLYFSDSTDITNTVQKSSSSPRSVTQLEYNCAHGAQDFFTNLSGTYLWNRGLLDALQVPQKHNFVVPVICGYVGSHHIEQLDLTIINIARISRHRAGIFSRRVGTDALGKVAFQVETETLLITADHIVSHVQIRGSLPVFWDLVIPEAKIDHRLVVDCDDGASDGSVNACRLHYDYLFRRYGGRVTIIDLLPSTIVELHEVVKSVYTSLGFNNNDPSLTSASYYYGGEVKEVLIPRLVDMLPRCVSSRLQHVIEPAMSLLQDTQPEIEKMINTCTDNVFLTQKYFMARKCIASNSIIQLQRGVYRSNDLECVDDTNFGQYLICSRTVQGIIEGTNFLPDGENQQRCRIGIALQRLWVDTGDALSNFYTGTHSQSSVNIKSAYHNRGNGTATLYNLMCNTSLRLARTYHSYFTDSLRQDDIRIFLCEYIGKESLKTHMNSVAKILMQDLYHQSWFVRYWKFIRLYFAPRCVRGVVRILVAGGWLLSYALVQRVSGLSSGEILKRSKSMIIDA